uniref:RNA-dependent RNA polymerase n=1 Tax=Rhizoctonia solani ourmia-like virus 6 TaxID=2818414 RepID=A0AAU6NDX1_9VIRU
MERAFGSLDRTGTGLFTYPGLRDMYIDEDAHTIFSLYLCRKCINVSRRSDFEKADEAFQARITTPRPEHPDRSRAAEVVGAICRVLFNSDVNPAAAPVVSVPNSNKSCIEWSSFKGGKRVGLANVAKTGCERVVRPKTIKSAGKLRTITIDSIKSQRFNSFNERALNALRGLPWMLSGRELDDVLSNDHRVHPTPDRPFYVSGDLEAATDTFATELSEAYIKELCENFSEYGEEDHDFEYLVNVTTRAQFFKPANGKRTNPVPCDCDKGHPEWCENAWEPTFKQCAGQLMGSIVSFPGLCIINALTGFTARGHFEDLYLHRNDTEWLWDFLNDPGHGFLVNGDDFLAPMSLEEIDRWTEAVKMIGGIVSRGKTLCHPYYGTINSELVRADYDSATRIPVLRPTLIAGLHDRAYKAPASVWKEYLKATSRWPEAAAEFDTDRTMFPRMPQQWGGFGSIRLEKDQFMQRIHEALALKEFRPCTAYDWVTVATEDRCQRTYDRFGSKAHIRARVLNPQYVPHIPPESPPPECKFYEGRYAPAGWYPRSTMRRFAAQKYGRDKHCMRWMEETNVRRDFYEVWKTAQEMAKYMTYPEREALWTAYNDCWDHPGMVLIRKPFLDPWKICDEPLPSTERHTALTRPLF